MFQIESAHHGLVNTFVICKVWIRGGDIVLVSLREFQDDVADIIYKYYRGEARSLVALKEIPESGTWL